MSKIFEFTIPRKSVAIKSIKVSAEISGQLNLQMNYIGAYDQTSQNIIVSEECQLTPKKTKYEFSE